MKACSSFAIKDTSICSLTEQFKILTISFSTYSNLDHFPTSNSQFPLFTHGSVPADYSFRDRGELSPLQKSIEWKNFASTAMRIRNRAIKKPNFHPNKGLGLNKTGKQVHSMKKLFLAKKVRQRIAEINAIKEQPWCEKNEALLVYNYKGRVPTKCSSFHV